jgi:predicted nucleic acid-binding protein
MIFVATSFWVAARNRRDGRHEEARVLLRRHGDHNLVTSNQVRGETWTYLRRRAGHPAAISFLDMLERSPRVTLLHVSEKQETKALGWLRRHDEREFSFVDATSFVLMRDHRIGEALTFDGDFGAAGFVELRA